MGRLLYRRHRSILAASVNAASFKDFHLIRKRFWSGEGSNAQRSLFRCRNPFHRISFREHAC